MRMIARFLGFLFATGAIVFVLGAAAVALVVWKFEQDLPDYTQLKNYEPPVMSRIHASDGSLLAEISNQRRLFLPASAIPALVKQAFISAEDKSFYTHNGIDPRGVLRAVLKQLQGGHVEGASTITQQVAKNFLLTNEKSYERKIREALLSFRIEATYSKEKILELYLNEIFFGLKSYGIAAAALDYYGKSVNELTLSEVAYLAGLPKGPNNYHPFQKREAAIERRNYVIGQMVENGYVKKADGDKAKAEPLGVDPRVLDTSSFVSGYFTEEVRRNLLDRYGETKLKEGGLSVRATLDPKMQLWARKALVDGLLRYDEAHGYRGAMRVIDITQDWGIALADVPSLSDVQPWRLAVVLEATDTYARVGLQPRREKSREVARDRETGTLGVEGIRWTGRGRVRATVQPGDVIYVEPLEIRTGQYRLRQIPEIGGAMVAMDPYTGRVLAMVGGFSYDQSEFNRATQASRQPGSSFKPFVYATALDNGYTPSSIVLDEPIEVPQADGTMWSPSNFEGDKGSGAHTLRYGVEHSHNMMTVRLAKDVGMPLIAEYAKRFGIYDDMQPVLSMSLGAGETTLLKMTTAYSMLANGGRRIKPTMIDRVQDRWGKTIYRHDERQCATCNSEKWNGQNEPKLVDKREQVLDPLTAFQITSIMEGVIQRGTGQSIKSVGKHLAGKTGTTNDAKDLWFVGFSPDLAVGVFMGYDRPRSMGDSAQAATYTAPIFRDFMTVALKDKPDIPFRPPAGIKLINVDPRTGLRSNGSDSIREAFKPGTAPPDSYAGGDGAGGGRNRPAAGTDSAVGTGTGGLY